ncbi:MAG TPA: DNA recombination protein RmuC [Phycisphaerales bacterium]|nr:DNA recombination protein RmuC [Phycisphaerales bacterium]
MDWMSLLLGLAVGGGVGAALVWATLQSRAAGAFERAKMLDAQLTQLNADLQATRQTALEAEVNAAQLAEQLRTKQGQFDEQKRLLEEAEKKLLAVFEATGARLLQANADRFMQQAEKSFEEKAKPIRELLDAQKKAVEEIEKKRETAYVRLDEQIKTIAASNEKLNTETSRLVTALRRPEQRGRWGEMQLRNVVELAGMTAHCDFHEQAQTDDAASRHRPDMIVNMPGGGVIVVDSKVSLVAYLDSIQPDADRAAELQRHARQVETHVKQLSSKAYWEQFDRTPRLVVMFMPLESALSAALEVKPDLHAEAMKQHVLIATPTLLVALLRAIAYGWQQEAIAENAKEIANVGRDLYDRLATFAGHFDSMGKGLERANASYNKAVGSLERNVLPGARRLRDLRATNADEIEGPKPIEIDVREITAAELRSLPTGSTGESE